VGDIGLEELPEGIASPLGLAIRGIGSRYISPNKKL